MNWFTRLSDIVSSNVHSLLDCAENPERVFERALRAMEDDVLAARQEAARALAAERRIQRERDSCRMARDQNLERAQNALLQGREDLARDALRRRADEEEALVSLERQTAAAHDLVAEVRNAVAALESRLSEARRRHALLLARKNTLQVRIRAQHALGAASRPESFALFGRIEQRLIEEEDLLLAQLDLTRKADPCADVESRRRAERVESDLRGLRERIAQGDNR